MPTLYGSTGSRSAAVEAALAVAGIACRQVAAASWQASVGLDELRRVNPVAQIPTLVGDDDSVKKAMQRRGRARLHELWDLFADQFPAAPWLSGERLGALDILAATVSKWSGARTHLAALRPAFSALLARIGADPRIAAVSARHWPAA